MVAYPGNDLLIDVGTEEARGMRTPLGEGEQGARRATAEVEDGGEIGESPIDTRQRLLQIAPTPRPRLDEALGVPRPVDPIPQLGRRQPHQAVGVHLRGGGGFLGPTLSLRYRRGRGAHARLDAPQDTLPHGFSLAWPPDDR